jgi:hypothetical protein
MGLGTIQALVLCFSAITTIMCEHLKGNAEKLQLGRLAGSSPADCLPGDQPGFAPSDVPPVKERAETLHA